MTIPVDTVSVIIPVFNGQRYLGAAIDSVLTQTWPASEIIVVDDGSSDNTASILAYYGSSLRVIRQANSGSSAATNRGLAAASGSVFCFLDADDVWVASKLQKQMDWLAAHREIEAVFGYMQQFVSGDLPPTEAARLACPTSAQPGISKCTIAIRRDAFERIGPFNNSLRSVDFIDWFARASEFSLRFDILPDVVALRRLHATNSGRRVAQSQMAENLLVLKKALDRRRAKGATVER